MSESMEVGPGPEDIEGEVYYRVSWDHDCEDCDTECAAMEVFADRVEDGEENVMVEKVTVVTELIADMEEMGG